MNAKQLTRIGIFYLEEAILDALPTPEEQHISGTEVSKRTGMYPGMPNTTTANAHWLARSVLEKLLEDARVDVIHSQGGTRRGWRLTHEEYESRIEDCRL